MGLHWPIHKRNLQVWRTKWHNPTLVIKCSLLDEPCSIADLYEFNERARLCVKLWQTSYHRKNRQPTYISNYNFNCSGCFFSQLSYFAREQKMQFFFWNLKFKLNISLLSLHYAEAWNELVGPIFASLRPGDKAPLDEMSQQWRAIGNIVSDLTGRDLNFWPPAPETNLLTLDQLARVIRNSTENSYVWTGSGWRSRQSSRVNLMCCSTGLPLAFSIKGAFRLDAKQPKFDVIDSSRKIETGSQPFASCRWRQILVASRCFASSLNAP